MFYMLIGKLVVRSVKYVLRTKYGRQYVPKPLLAGIVLAAAAGGALVALKHDKDDE